MAAHLIKPVRQDDLRKALERAMTAGGRSVGRVERFPTVEVKGQRGERQRSGVPVRRRGGFRILLAEDNPVNQRVAMVMLRKLGHQVSVVDDGAQAVDAGGSGDRSISR